VIKSKIFTSSNVNLRDNLAYKSVVGRVRTSFIGATNSKRGSSASESVKEMLKKKKMLKKKRSVIENVRV
jgi:hypothetical protein